MPSFAAFVDLLAHNVDRNSRRFLRSKFRSQFGSLLLVIRNEVVYDLPDDQKIEAAGLDRKS